jgi:hypothetical protein
MSATGPLSAQPTRRVGPPATPKNRAPSDPRFRALALLGRLTSDHRDGLAMQASEKPTRKRSSTEAGLTATSLIRRR